jgi:hypothetical protein
MKPGTDAEHHDRHTDRRWRRRRGFLTERLTTVQLDDPHFAAQLVERLKWAGADAERAEREAAA